MDDVLRRMTERFDHHDAELTDDGTLARVYGHMREVCPVQWTDSHGGYWVATRFEDVERVTRNHENFVSALGMTIPDLTDALPEDDRRARLASGRGLLPLLFYDPPAHGSLRRCLEPLFSPAEVRRREHDLRVVADEFIDHFVDDQECELVSQYCAPVPAVVALDWLGLPSDDWKTWSDAVLKQMSDPGEYGPDIGAIDFAKLASVVAERRDNPTGDAISLMAGAVVDGEPLDDGDLLMALAVLVFGGLETTTNAAAGAVVELARRPDLRDELAGTPQNDRLWDSAVEEFLRFCAPTPGVMRTARSSAEVGAKEVNAGERVYVALRSANFDDSVFEQPEELNIRRKTNRHMTFGRGIHRCIGSHLARLELKVMVQQIVARLPAFTVDEAQLDLHRSVGSAYGYDRVPMRFGR